MVIRASRNFSEVAKGRKVHEFWDFPKGRLDKGETGIGAALREAKEEVGLDNFEVVPDFKETIRYFTWRGGKPIPKFVALFLARTKTSKVKLSWEHDKYEWLSYTEAVRLVTLPQMKDALRKSENFLSR